MRHDRVGNGVSWEWLARDVCEDGAQERRVGKHSNIECTLSRFSKLTKGGSTGSADTGQSVKKEDELSGRLRQRFAYYLRDVAHNAGWHYLARQPVDQRALRHSTTQPIHVSQHHPTPHHITSQHFKTRHIATHHATSHHRRPHDAASHHSTSGDLGLSPFRSASST